MGILPIIALCLWDGGRNLHGFEKWTNSQKAINNFVES